MVGPGVAGPSPGDNPAIVYSSLPFVTALAASIACAVAALGAGAPAGTPAPVPPLPSTAQIAWQRMETNAFVHFGPNTFTSVEWGSGREDPAVFNPTAFDARQWVRVFKAAGLRGVIVTAKHHDGFCLWPSKLSTHTVARSPWRDGRGDVLRELSDACREAGLAFGVYLSPWDRNHPTYGTPEYNRVFAGMLEEVLGGYGPIFEVWFDGANGEGPNGRRQEYDWPLFHATVRRLQPQAVIFSDAGPGVRWVGNERGEGAMTSWSLIDRDRYLPGTALSDELGEGTSLGRDWVPPECDVSIRPGWFYRASEDARVKPAERLFRLYEQSVGRNCLLLLNVPPDTRGRIAGPDEAALAGMRRLIETVYGTNLARRGRAEGEGGHAGDHVPARVLDGDPETFWAPADGSHRATLTIALERAETFDRVVLQEPIALGQRIATFEIEAWAASRWERIGFGTTVGSKRIVTVPLTTADRIRVVVHHARGVPLVAEVSLHRTPAGS
jgi:alpha-L-fucosidase